VNGDSPSGLAARCGRFAITIREIGESTVTAVHFEPFRLWQTRVLSIGRNGNSLMVPCRVVKSEITSERDPGTGRFAYASIFEITEPTPEMLEALKRYK
jgi:hypothetical protein